MTFTVLQLLRAATRHLEAKGCDTPRLDAELLLAHVMARDRVGVYMAHDMAVPEAWRSAYRELVRRRARGEPVAYILGRKEFYGLSIEVDRRCLIPRPETEHLVDVARDCLRHLGGEAGDGRDLRVVEVGCGSGCVIIALARYFPRATYFALDLSEGALEVARANAGRLLPGVTIHFLQGDVLAPLAQQDSFHLILSNPPYVDDLAFEELPREVRDQEPALALRAGSDSLALHRRILRAGLPRLSPQGRILLELPGDVEGEVARQLALEAGGGARWFCDLASRPRVLEVWGAAPA